MTFSNPYIAILFITCFTGIMAWFMIQSALPVFKAAWKECKKVYDLKMAQRQLRLHPDEVKIHYFATPQFVICRGDLYDEDTKILYCCREFCRCEFCNK